MSHRGPNILYIDAYDSFANNIVALVHTSIPGSQVQVIKHDDPRFFRKDPAIFSRFLNGFDAVVAGPGPGHPCRDNDVGIIRQLWTLHGSDALPVLGICLGFQSLCAALGLPVC